ncbi:DUF397 domain-containing protein [Streptomyces sp. B93]|uniref:DUF397 domain-containing protein n=1 Tax=Streptomyces sp. B93 TaxID=2824875 RepID=UPI001B391831|nr:DUF397 domain-containing protein [Streptomyces sp. B93]MBQ1090135.1 DUF397 domain-containing protein [Streptomyces sp. B93]
MKASSPAPADDLSWYKSSYSSGSGGDCVEIADAGAAVLVRDSKQPHAAVISVPSVPWVAFVRMAARG